MKHRNQGSTYNIGLTFSQEGPKVEKLGHLCARIFFQQRPEETMADTGGGSARVGWASRNGSRWTGVGTRMGLCLESVKRQPGHHVSLTSC